MSFISYSHFILIISGQTFEVTVVHEKFWELNRTLVSRKKFGQNFLATFATLIRSIKHILIIKLITRMDGNSRDESIKPN